MKTLVALTLGLSLLAAAPAHAYPGCWWDGYAWQCPSVGYAPYAWGWRDYGWHRHHEHHEDHEHHEHRH